MQISWQWKYRISISCLEEGAGFLWPDPISETSWTDRSDLIQTSCCCPWVPAVLAVCFCISFLKFDLLLFPVPQHWLHFSASRSSPFCPMWVHLEAHITSLNSYLWPLQPLQILMSSWLQASTPPCHVMLPWGAVLLAGRDYLDSRL